MQQLIIVDSTQIFRNECILNHEVRNDVPSHTLTHGQQMNDNEGVTMATTGPLLKNLTKFGKKGLLLRSAQCFSACSLVGTTIFTDTNLSKRMNFCVQVMHDDLLKSFLFESRNDFSYEVSLHSIRFYCNKGSLVLGA